MDWTSEYFLTESGKSPVQEFISSLNLRTRQKFYYVRSLLDEFGVKLGLPYCKRLRHDIFELRFVGAEGQVRVLYFFMTGNRIIFTNAFIKKTQKTPSESK